MKPRKEAIDFLIHRIKMFENIYGAIAVGSDIGALGPLSLPSDTAEDIENRCREIIVDVDTIALQKALIECATAIGDASHLLIESIEHGDRLFLEEAKRPDAEEQLLSKFYSPREASIDESILVDYRAFKDAGDYIKKAIELLRAPAFKIGMDIDSLENKGGIFL